jgi:hypothetical protein
MKRKDFMKSKPKGFSQELDGATETAKTLLKEALVNLVQAAKSQPAETGGRLFFPSGIQFIDVQVKVQNVVDVHFTVSGAPKVKAQCMSLDRGSHVLADGQQVINSCEAHWDAFQSDCSGFVKAVAGDFGIVLTGQADDIVDQINTGDWQQLADGAAAEAKAEAGFLVIAGLKGADQTPPREHGHVVVVVQGPLAFGKYPTAYWGTLGGVGKKNTTLNYAWNTDDRDNVVYRCKSANQIL